MKEKDTFIICFNSRDMNIVGDNTTAGGRCNLSYNINWAMFLPKKYRKYTCQFTFTSENFAGGLTACGWVNINTGRMDIYDGFTMMNNLGIIVPVYTGATSFYNATTNDNPTFIIDYPTNNQVKVSLKNFSNTDITNMPHYCIYLSLTGIKEAELDHTN
jgi:hypothetical protein